ncbi:unnamed protein product, partial [Staurois parvus]
KRRQAGRVNINRAGRYRGSKRRLVRVTSQGSEQEKSAAVQKQDAGQKPDAGQKQDAGQKPDAGPRTNTHQGRVCGSGHPLNTPA